MKIGSARPAEDAAPSYLTAAWRNGTRILDAANAVAAPYPADADAACGAVSSSAVGNAKKAASGRPFACSPQAHDGGALPGTPGSLAVGRPPTLS